MTRLFILLFTLFISGCAAKQVYIPVPQEPENGTKETKPEKSEDEAANGEAATKEILKNSPPENK